MLKNKVTKNGREPWLKSGGGWDPDIWERLNLTGRKKVITGGPTPGIFYENAERKRKFCFFGPWVPYYT